MSVGDPLGRDERALAEHDLGLRAEYVIGRLDRVLRRELRELLRPHGLSLPAFTTLSVLRRRPGLSNAQLARRSLVTPQAMNEIVAGLLERRLVTRRADPNHNRVLQTRLTARGRRLIDACEAESRALEERMLAGIAAGRRELLLDVLRTCVRNLGAGL